MAPLFVLMVTWARATQPPWPLNQTVTRVSPRPWLEHGSERPPSPVLEQLVLWDLGARSRSLPRVGPWLDGAGEVTRQTPD